MKHPKGKYAWTAKIGEKGQIVIPKEARELFGFKPGDTLLLLGDEAQGIAIVKNDMFTELANKVFGPPGKEETE
ncbi:AbrB/MazE/SpoVT family DNA-binding domain-containing protein [Paenibacillus sp. JCM 10914]|uniref:AbrB/MazE/SpoVT family DNA-binding domain-containing protein n=1 Tax=Paenibacillus sp. JCM 10914 TaxID=1236974 RepID=UPI0003CC813A|nr:AbrB/MazE/SpoVT family DNA-binding domain-containing protein [Paenibacillus sp. JCM 10914]GAE06868.1 transcriptional regulator, AbrB family [Paenibacillus sp. JCM 10914]